MPHLLNAHAALQVYKYAYTLFIIDGLGHTTWSSMMPVSRSRMASLVNCHISFPVLVALEPLILLMSQFGAVVRE